jgi:general secretion pathway protein C
MDILDFIDALGRRGIINDNRRMVSRIAAFVIWAAVAASAVFWAMRLWVKPVAVPTHATLVSSASSFNGDLTRLFGPDAAPAESAAAPDVPPPQADARFKLIGVVAPRSTAARAEGLALIATDGKPPRAYRVGTVVDGEMVLQAVHARGAALGLRGQSAQVALELPLLPPPTTGVPMAGGGAPPAPRAMPTPLPRPGPPALPQAQPAPEVQQDESPGQAIDPPSLPRPPTVPNTSPGRMRLPA